jgi:hypothetical protein
MAYQVDKFNGQFLVSVEDGTIDTSTDLRLVGKNYAGYGELQNENFLHLLENFSNTTEPPKKITGQIWYDSANKRLKYYNGSRFKMAGGAEPADIAPSGLAVGEFWWDTSSKQLKAWTGADFVLVGPVASPDSGTTTISPASVLGTINTAVGPHTILKVIADDKVIGIFSKAEFTIASSPENSIEDFSVIKKGFTLAKSQSGISTDSFIVWGTAENSNKLGGFSADQYIRIGDNEFVGEVKFRDPGYTLGDGNDLRVRVENGNEVVFENRLGNDITFRITVAETTDERDIAVIRSTGVVPGNDNTYSLGTELSRWNNIFSTSFTGNLIGSVTGNTTGIHKGNVISNDNTIIINATTNQIGYTGANLVGTLEGSCTGSSTTATNASKLNDLDPSIAVPLTAVSSIPIRDSLGNIYANQFIGISDSTEKIRINDSASDPVWNNSTVSTQYRAARTTKTPWSIAARDANGDLTADRFNGTATAAQYADLAEKYLPDAEYDVGTVMMIGGEKEVTASSWGKRAIGVISENPAFMMNKDLEGGVYVALKGRVPVKVIGRIKKGDDLIAANNGCAMMAVPHANGVFAVALESSDDEGVKVIEALVI